LAVCFAIALPSCVRSTIKSRSKSAKALKTVKIQPTDIYIDELETEINRNTDLITATDKKEIISKVAKAIKKRKSKRDVKRIFDKFFIVSASERPRNKRLNSYELINHKHIMNLHNLDREAYEKIKLNYEYNYKQ